MSHMQYLVHVRLHHFFSVLYLATAFETWFGNTFRYTAVARSPLSARAIIRGVRLQVRDSHWFLLCSKV